MPRPLAQPITIGADGDDDDDGTVSDASTVDLTVASPVPMPIDSPVPLPLPIDLTRTSPEPVSVPVSEPVPLVANVSDGDVDGDVDVVAVSDHDGDNDNGDDHDHASDSDDVLCVINIDDDSTPRATTSTRSMQRTTLHSDEELARMLQEQEARIAGNATNGVYALGGQGQASSSSSASSSTQAALPASSSSSTTRRSRQPRESFDRRMAEELQREEEQQHHHRSQGHHHHTTTTNDAMPNHVTNRMTTRTRSSQENLARMYLQQMLDTDRRFASSHARGERFNPYQRMMAGIPASLLFGNGGAVGGAGHGHVHGAGGGGVVGDTYEELMALAERVGEVKRGLTLADIRRLPKLTYDAAKPREDKRYHCGHCCVLLPCTTMTRSYRYYSTSAPILQLLHLHGRVSTQAETHHALMHACVSHDLLVCVNFIDATRHTTLPQLPRRMHHRLAQG